MTQDMILQHLSDSYAIWLDAEAIPEPYRHEDAQGLLFSYAQHLTSPQRAWLNHFISLWDSTLML